MQESRVKKTILNARVNTICYFLSLFVAFFTRRVFIEHLGTEFLGLSGTLSSLLGFLNLAELGVGGSIGYFLYKPLVERDEEKMRQLISLLGYLYRIIGSVILAAGVLLALFLPIIYPDLQFSLSVVYVGYFAILASSLIGYFCNYKAMLLWSDQRGYVVTGYFQLTTTIKVILQMVLAIYLTNFILYFVIEFLFGVVNALILHYKVRVTYPWLRTDLSRGRELFRLYPEVWRKVRDIFFHKIGSFVQYQIMPFFIYGYVSLPMVALYNNYTIITQKLQSLVGGVLGSSGAGVGTLIAEGDITKIYNTHKEIFALNYFAPFFIASSIYYLIPDFIVLWLGSDEYILGESVAFLICLNLFLSMARGVIDQFIAGYGLFHDVWAPLVESLIFVVVSTIFGYFYGLPGVLLGPVVSLIIVIYLWKPYFLYSQGLHIPFYRYFLLLLQHLVPLVVSYFVAVQLLSYIPLAFASPWVTWIVKATLFVMFEGLLSFLSLYLVSSAWRSLLHRFLRRRR